MLIALLAMLGVDLIVIVGVLAVVLSGKRWVMRQPGASRGAIRVASGDRRSSAEMAPRIPTLGR